MGGSPAFLFDREEFLLFIDIDLRCSLNLGLDWLKRLKFNPDLEPNGASY